MNDGVNTTPGQAARSLRIVRLVSFGAAALLAVTLALLAASVRYSLQWAPASDAVVIVSEIARDAPAAERPRARDTPPPSPAQREDAVAAPPAAESNAAPSEPVTITNPTWLERPRHPERYYPRDAFMRGVAGEAVLSCDVDVAGRMTCVVVSETPEGFGFGDAALRIAHAHVMQPATQDGTAVRGRYRMVVPFSPGN